MDAKKPTSVTLALWFDSGGLTDVVSDEVSDVVQSPDYAGTWLSADVCAT